MNVLDRIPLRPHYAAHLLRFALAAIFLSHGVTRAYMGRVDPFGESLDAWGFPVGIAWAWGVTVFEIVGGLLLVANRLIRPISLLFASEILTGIFLVHRPHGWFVVGHGQNGMEFSVLIFASLLALFALRQPGGLRTRAATASSPLAEAARHAEADLRRACR